MSIRCSLGWHEAKPLARWNDGYYFSTCRRCGRDLVRTAFETWHEVPAGHRVVWSATPPPGRRTATLAPQETGAPRAENEAKPTPVAEPVAPQAADPIADMTHPARDVVPAEPIAVAELKSEPEPAPSAEAVVDARPSDKPDAATSPAAAPETISVMEPPSPPAPVLAPTPAPPSPPSGSLPIAEVLRLLREDDERALIVAPSAATTADSLDPPPADAPIRPDDAGEAATDVVSSSEAEEDLEDASEISDGGAGSVDATTPDPHPDETEAESTDDDATDKVEDADAESESDAADEIVSDETMVPSIPVEPEPVDPIAAADASVEAPDIDAMPSAAMVDEAAEDLDRPSDAAPVESAEPGESAEVGPAEADQKPAPAKPTMFDEDFMAEPDQPVEDSDFWVETSSDASGAVPSQEAPAEPAEPAVEPQPEPLVLDEQSADVIAPLPAAPADEGSVTVTPSEPQSAEVGPPAPLPASDTPPLPLAGATAAFAPPPAPGPATAAQAGKPAKPSFPSAAPTQVRTRIQAMDMPASSRGRIGLALGAALVLGALAFVATRVVGSGDSAQENAAPPALGTDAAGATVAGQEPIGTAFVAARLLNCRASPILGARSLRILGRGETVQVLAREPGWVSVAHEGRQCWVSARYLSAQQPL